MPVPKLQPGQAYRTKAAHFNAFADAANAYSAGRLGGAVDLRATPWQTDVRLIRNDSGEDCDAGDCLAIDGVLVTPEDVEIDQNFLRWGPQLVFLGVKPDLESPVVLNEHIGHFAVLLEPIPDGKTGLAVFSGIVTAPIDMVYPDHPMADVAHDTFRLTSNWYGSAEILYKVEHPPDSGDWYAAVRVSNFHSEILDVVVAETYGIEYGASGSAEVWWGGAETDPVQTVEIDFNWLGSGSTLANGQKLVVYYRRDIQAWRPLAEDCP